VAGTHLAGTGLAEELFRSRGHIFVYSVQVSSGAGCMWY